jgi:hypothetical protein
MSLVIIIELPDLEDAEAPKAEAGKAEAAPAKKE